MEINYNTTNKVITISDASGYTWTTEVYGYFFSLSKSTGYGDGEIKVIPAAKDSENILDGKVLIRLRNGLLRCIKEIDIQSAS